MSFKRLASLVGGAQQKLVEAQLTTGYAAQKLRNDARDLLIDADRVAVKGEVAVIHQEHGVGVVVGVDKGALVEVFFGDSTVRLPLDQLVDADDGAAL